MYGTFIYRQQVVRKAQDLPTSSEAVYYQNKLRSQNSSKTTKI